tara:strand:+ start:150 stop:1007 length:858 start_codon:yes stop_codon:yes gene_type:complete
MPEAPEVEVMNQEIDSDFKGKQLLNYNILKGKAKKKRPKLFLSFEKDLNNGIAILKDVTRRGKLLSLEFEFDIKGKKKTWWVCNYFGLHGSYRIDDDKIVPNYDKGNKNVHISLEFKKTDSESSYLNYYDTSGFGSSFTFYNNLDEYLKYLYKNAIDVFDEEFDIKTFKKNFEIVKLKPLSKFNIASILINQGYLCSGIGNYLKCEILYEAKISPNRSINDIKDEELEVLYKAIKKVCELHLSKEGRSEEHLKVYGKKVDADGNEIKYEETQDGKKTYWIPEIQK